MEKNIQGTRNTDEKRPGVEDHGAYEELKKSLQQEQRDKKGER